MSTTVTTTPQTPDPDTGTVPPVDTGTIPFDDTATDTGCSVDLATWDLDVHWERSEMADRVQTDTIGVCLPETLMLPTVPTNVWDSGSYTPTDRTDEGRSAGREWASWDQVGEVDCHRFTLTVDLPPCDWSALQLSSPWFDGVAINDNLYVIVAGITQWTGGTSYGAVGAGPNETDGWLSDGVTELPASLLGIGPTTIDLVVEEREEWGGLGLIEPVLVP